MKGICIFVIGCALAACAGDDPAAQATSDLSAPPVAPTDWYVVNSNSNTVTLSLNGAGCASFFGSLAVGERPTGVAVNPSGTRVYVTNYGSTTTNGTISVIDISNTLIPAVIATIPVGSSLTGIAIDPIRPRAYTTQQGTGRVSVIDLGSNTVLTATFVPGNTNGSNGIAVNRAGTRIYVATSAGLQVVDASSLALIATVAVGATGVAVSPDDSRVYVTNVSGILSAVDAESNTVVADLLLEGGPFGVAVHPSGARVYVVTNLNSGGFPLPGKLLAIDTSSLTVAATRTVGADPYGVAVSRSLVVVSNSGAGVDDGSVSLFDANTLGSLGTPPVGSIPGGVAVFQPPDPPPLRADVDVAAFEVTQAIQDFGNSVPLIQGRNTFVRVHVKSTNPAVSVPGVTATLFGVRETCAGPTCRRSVIGTLAPASPGPWVTVKGNPKRNVLADGFLFELPPSWVSAPRLDLYVVLHGAGAATCRLDAPHSFHFLEPAYPLTIQFIRLSYFLAGQKIEATVPEQSQSESYIRRTYPLANLTSAGDMPLFDGPLSTRVDRSAPECQKLDLDKRNQCADRYIQTKLSMEGTLFGKGTPSVVGDADGAYALIPQASNGQCADASDGSRPCFTRGSCCTLGVGAGPSDRNAYAAHEIGHLLGRQHPVEGGFLCRHSEDDPDYPYALSLIHPLVPYDPATGLAGFDPGDASLGISRGPLDAFAIYDLMGYCDPLWISDYTYNHLYTAVRARHPEIGATGSTAAAGAAQPGDWLAVFGNVTSADAYLQVRRVDRTAAIPPRTPGGYSIRLLGAGGEILADYPFTPHPVADEPGTGSFGQVVPFVAGTRTIQVVATAGNLPLAAESVSASAPTIGGVALQGAAEPIVGTVTMAWTAADPDGDPLTFDIFYTPDGGASLQPLMLGVSGASAQVDTSHLGGGLGQLRVMASDGVHTAFADTAPFVLADKPPRPRILSPADGTSVVVGQLVSLEGQATDAQDGVIPDAGLSWSAAGRALGTGARVSVADLPVGTHALTLTATNSLGLSATATVTVTVMEVPPPPGPTLAAGPLRIGWHVADGDGVPQTAVVDVSNGGSGELSFTAQSGAPWLRLSATSGTAPASLTLTADPSGFSTGTTARTEVVLTGAGQTIAIPVTLSVGNTFDADKGPGACRAGDACTTSLPGVCRDGTIVCAGGTATCVPNRQPRAETCDGLDDDCDGAVDDGFDVGASCSVGVGSCLRTGSNVCAADGAGTQCDAVPGGPSPEICGNGIDEDCDGADLACSSEDACVPTPILDDFDRADGRVGDSWRGAIGPFFYRIAGHRLDVNLGGLLYWNAAFGTDQAASVKLSRVDCHSPSQGVLLKVQTTSLLEAGAIAVVYDAQAGVVRASAIRLGAREWTRYRTTPALFSDGDKLGACAKADGEVRIYKNDGLIDTFTLSREDRQFFNPRGGKVGLWSAFAPHAILDDFGGGTIAP